MRMSAQINLTTFSLQEVDIDSSRAMTVFGVNFSVRRIDDAEKRVIAEGIAVSFHGDERGDPLLVQLAVAQMKIDVAIRMTETDRLKDFAIAVRIADYADFHFPKKKDHARWSVLIALRRLASSRLPRNES